MEFCALASGSSGNCIYVGHEDTALLVDAGISGKKIAEGLAGLNVSPESIKGILITHEHGDHIQGASVFSRKYNVPIYGTCGTLKYIADTARCAPDAELLKCITPDRDFTVGSIDISPFRISHDAVDPVSYCLKAGGKKLGMATDLGVFTEYTITQLRNADALYLEANHDENMLLLGSYPYRLKQRIASEKGHLSNEDCAGLVRILRHEALQTVVLAHVSLENNFEELAFETVRQVIAGDDRFTNVPQLLVAKRYEPTGLIRL